MQNHVWSLTEYEKDPLAQGEVYCIECDKRSAKLVCTTCWDSYCDECFGYVHHCGVLKDHVAIPYRKAKKGWMCVKGRVQGEQDYYVNGRTGETTFEKPLDLMTEQEKVYYENYVTHKKAAEEYVKQIEKLQFDVEAANYERDTIMFDAMQRTNKKKDKTRTAIEDAQNKKGLLSQLFSGISYEYREKITNPQVRDRGKAQTDYIKELLDEDDGF